MVEQDTSKLFAGDAVRIGPIIGIPRLLWRYRVDPAEILSEAKLPPDLFSDADNLISFSARSHLISLCVEKTGCRHFGLELGRGAALPSLGLIGYLAMNSADLRTALKTLVRYFHLHSRGSLLTLKVEGDYAFFGYTIYQSGSEAIAQIEDAAVAIMFNILRSLCGPEWTAVEACFTRQVPSSLGPYRDFFRTRLRFNAEYSGAYFSTSWLDRPINDADPELRHVLQNQVRQLEALYARDFPSQVQHMILTSLPTGQSNADQIAALFSIHPRTLSRRLQRYGTSFHQLADAARYEFSRQLLCDSGMNLGEISEIVGYSDASSFTKAFRRWSGMTPSQWQQQQE